MGIIMNNLSKLLSIAVLYSVAFAVGPNDVFDLKLEQLMNIKVSVASKQDVSQSDAPGVVTVYNKNEIESLGYYTIKEIAAITPGFSSANIFAGQTNLVVRGQKVEGFDNNKVLIILDGKPVSHLRNGRASIDEDMSLIGVEKIEFLKGPGSALYGTGAFFGVINIITQSPKDAGKSSKAMFYAGSFGTKGVRGVTTFNTGLTSGKIRVSQVSQGPTGKLYGYQSGTQAYEKRKNRTNHNFDTINDLNIHTEVKVNDGPLKNFTLDYLTSKNEHGTFESLNDYNSYSYKFETSSISVGYEKYIGDKLELSSFVRYTNSIEEGNRYNYNYLFKGYDGSLEIQSKRSNNSAFIAGLTYDYRYQASNDDGNKVSNGQGSNAFIESGSGPLRTMSLYGQYSNKYNVMKGLLFTLGIRYEEINSDYAKVSKYSPRLSLVQKLNDNLNLKLIYASALRSPDLKSTLINAVVLEEGGTLKQEKLDAETADSYEVGLTYNNTKFANSFSLFYVVIKDAINRRSFNGKDSYRNDLGNTTSHGLEYESKYKLNSNHEFFFNTTYSKARLDSVAEESSINGQEIEATPRVSLNLGTFIKYHRFSSTLVGKYIDEFRSADQDERDNGFFLLDLYTKYNYNKDLAFSLKVSNLIGRDTRVPSFQEQYFPRTILGGAEYNF